MAARTIGFRKLSFILDGFNRQPLSPIDKYVIDFEIYCPTSNGSDVFIGDSTVDNTWIPINPGEIKNYVHGTGVMIGQGHVGAFNFKNLYIDGRGAGDQVIIQYFEYENS